MYNTVGMIRGLMLGGYNMAVANSWVSDFQDNSEEAQAIAFQDSPGPFTIFNNELEAAGENLYFLDPLATLDAIIPSDAWIQCNHLMKQLSWMNGPYIIKNLFEVKNGQRILFDTNILENCWVGAQAGAAILLTPRTEYGADPNAIAQDITITHNIIRNTAGGLVVASYDSDCPSNISSQTSHRILIQNNLFSGISNTLGNGWVLQVDEMHEFTFDHNTTQTVYSNNFMPQSVFVDSYPNENAIISNNIFDQNIDGQSVAGPCAFFNGTYQGNSNSGNQVYNNLLIGPGYQNGVTQSMVTTEWSNLYAQNTFYVASPSDVGYRDYNTGNYSLLPSSPYLHRASNGSQLGFDPSAINFNSVMDGHPAFRYVNTVSYD